MFAVIYLCSILANLVINTALEGQHIHIPSCNSIKAQLVHADFVTMAIQESTTIAAMYCKLGTITGKSNILLEQMQGSLMVS